MDSNVSTLIVSSLSEAGEGQKDHGAGDSLLQSQFVLQKESSHVPMNFIWPKEYLVKAIEEIREPVVDLSGFLKGDLVSTDQDAAMLIREACLKHGFFQITGHDVDPRLIQMAYDHLDLFFKLPVSMKLRAKRMPGTNWGYSGAHADRFSSKLPWKETLLSLL